MTICTVDRRKKRRTQRFFFICRLILIKLGHLYPNLHRRQSMFEDFVGEFVPAEGRWQCRKRDSSAKMIFFPGRTVFPKSQSEQWIEGKGRNIAKVRCGFFCRLILIKLGYPSHPSQASIYV